MKALKPIWIVRFFSGLFMFAGIVAFLYNVLATVVDSTGAKPEVQAV